MAGGMPRPILALALAFALTGAVSGWADEPPTPPSEGSTGTLDAVDLVGPREIYSRFLSNRHRSATLRLVIVSQEPDADPQEAELLVRFRDYRDGNLAPPPGEVVSKTVVRVERPWSDRLLTYLVVGRRERPRDEFVYVPEMRKTRRIRLRGFGLLGTRVTVDDLLFQSLDDATYQRLPDEEVAGVPTFVVRATQAEHMDTLYRHAIAYISKDRYVLLRAVYQDALGQTVREMRANPESIEEHEGVWIASEMSILDPLHDQSTTLSIVALEPNAKLDERDFSAYQLFHRHY